MRWGGHGLGTEFPPSALLADSLASLLLSPRKPAFSQMMPRYSSGDCTRCGGCPSVVETRSLPHCLTSGSAYRPFSALFGGVGGAWEPTTGFAQSYWVQKYAAADVCCFQDANLDSGAGRVPATHNVFPFCITTRRTAGLCCAKGATVHKYIGSPSPPPLKIAAK